MQTKRQKQEKVLSRLEKELELEEAHYSESKAQASYEAQPAYFVSLGYKLYYLRGQVKILRQKLGLKRYLVCPYPKCQAESEKTTVGNCDCCGTTTVEVWK